MRASDRVSIIGYGSDACCVQQQQKGWSLSVTNIVGHGEAAAYAEFELCSGNADYADFGGMYIGAVSQHQELNLNERHTARTNDDGYFLGLIYGGTSFISVCQHIEFW